MEGRPISVTVELVLPSQPVIGEVDYLPLGGDGFQAPFAAYQVRGLGAVSDAGGGFTQIRCVMDERYCSLVSTVMIRNIQTTPANADVRLRLSALRMAGVDLSELKVAQDIALGTSTITRTWEPPPIVLPGSGSTDTFVELRMENILADQLFLDALIYLFDIRVRELTPMGPLLFARGSR